MQNASRKSNYDQSVSFGSNVHRKWKPFKGDINSLKRRLKESQKKEIKGKFIFTTVLVTGILVSGIIISF